jgi:hypothetical protein
VGARQERKVLVHIRQTAPTLRSGRWRPGEPGGGRAL